MSNYIAYKPLPVVLACYKTRIFMRGKFLCRVEGVKLYIIFKFCLFYCDKFFSWREVIEWFDPCVITPVWMLTEVSAWNMHFMSMVSAQCMSLNLFGVLSCCPQCMIRWRVRIPWQGMLNFLYNSLQSTFLLAAAIILVIFFWVWSTILIVTHGFHICVRTLSKESACCKSNLWYFILFNGDFW
jgi:hypothetical protein